MKNLSLNKKANTKLIKAVAMGVIVSSAMCGFIMYVISALVTVIGSVPTDYLSILSLMSAVIGTFIGSYIAGRFYKEKGFLLGGIIGIIFSLIIIIISLSLDNYTNMATTATKFISIILSGVISGIISVNKKKKYKI